MGHDINISCFDPLFNALGIDVDLFTSIRLVNDVKKYKQNMHHYELSYVLDYAELNVS